MERFRTSEIFWGFSCLTWFPWNLTDDLGVLSTLTLCVGADDTGTIHFDYTSAIFRKILSHQSLVCVHILLVPEPQISISSPPQLMWNHLLIVVVNLRLSQTSQRIGRNQQSIFAAGWRVPPRTSKNHTPVLSCQDVSPHFSIFKWGLVFQEGSAKTPKWSLPRSQWRGQQHCTHARIL